MTSKVNPNSKLQLAMRNGISYRTFYDRLDRGWDKMDALIVPPKRNKRINDEQVIECEKLGLTMRRSAFLLGVSYQALQQRIKKLGIDWRGKGERI